MKTNLKVNGATILSRERQRQITGKAAIDLSLCGCNEYGGYTGPEYCRNFINCTRPPF